MEGVRLQITVPRNRRVKLQLPEGVPAGPAEILVLPQSAAAAPPKLGVPASRSPWETMLEGLRSDRRPFQDLNAQEHRARLNLVAGAGRGLLSTSEELAAWKREDLALEEAKFARRR